MAAIAQIADHRPDTQSSARDFVRPHETADYNQLRAALLAQILPTGVIEQLYADEIVSAAWRLRRCATLEAIMAVRGPVLDPMEDAKTTGVQNSIDRARAQANRILASAARQLRELRAHRPAPVAEITNQTQSAPPASAPVPRSAPCHCGSGIKFKRCCGRNAPAVLGPPACESLLRGSRIESRTITN